MIGTNAFKAAFERIDNRLAQFRGRFDAVAIFREHGAAQVTARKLILLAGK